jgi:hypothetical protein
MGAFLVDNAPKGAPGERESRLPQRTHMHTSMSLASAPWQEALEISGEAQLKSAFS